MGYEFSLVCSKTIFRLFGSQAMLRKREVICLELGFLDLNHRWVNSTHNDTQTSFLSTNHILGWKIILLGMVCFVFTSNLLLIYGFHKTSRPFNITSKLFILLSVLDMVYCSGCTLNALFCIVITEYPCDVFHAFLSFNHFLFLFVFCVFATISMLRFLALKKPFWIVSPFRIYVVLFISFITSLAYGATYYYLYTQDDLKKLDVTDIFGATSLSISMVFTLVINILSYVHLNRSINGKKKMENASTELDHQSSSGNHRQQDRDGISPQGESDERKREAVKTLIIITLFYIICYLPMTVYMIVSSSGLVQSQEVRMMVLFYFSLTNGGCNSLIYILRCQKIRRLFTAFKGFHISFSHFHSRMITSSFRPSP